VRHKGNEAKKGCPKGRGFWTKRKLLAMAKEKREGEFDGRNVKVRAKHVAMGGSKGKKPSEKKAGGGLSASPGGQGS